MNTRNRRHVAETVLEATRLVGRPIFFSLAIIILAFLPVTKSYERLSLHFNGGYEFLTDAGHGERDGRYKLVLGGSYPVGAPKFTRATLVADVFTEQSVHRGETNVVGMELGLRYQLTPRIVWDVGGGTEFAGPGDRSRFFGVTGFSFGF